VTGVARLRSFLRAVMHRRRTEQEIDEELRFHLEQRIADLTRDGMTESAAIRRARVDFGGFDAKKEEIRETLGLRMMDELRADVRYAMRVLRGRPLVTTVLVLTLALGIGANVAIFSFVDAVLLAPLPYPGSDRLVGIWERRPTGGRNSMTTLNYLDYARENRVFEDMAATTVCCGATMLATDSTPVPLGGLKVSASYFDVLGGRAAYGRTFVAGEDQPGRDHVVVLSHRVWASRFGSDVALIGQSIQLNNQPYTVIGVMPENSPFDRGAAELWLPISFDGERMNRASHWLLSITGGALGRLKAGVTIEQARTELNAIAARLSTQYPDTNKGWGVVLEPYATIVVGTELRHSLLLLLAAVGVVLIIACVNVMNLTLASALARDREVAVRLALGAGLRRLLQQFLTESLVIALSGGLLGMACGYVTMSFLRVTVASLPVTLGTLNILLPAEASVQLNWRVLSFALLASLACGLAFGLTPAIGLIRATRVAASASGVRTSTSLTHRHVGSALIVAQVALAFVLLTSAGLLLRSFLKMRDAPTGFDASHVVAVQMAGLAQRFTNSPQLHNFTREVIARLRALPSVSDAAFVDSFPMEGAPAGTFVQLASRPIVERAQRPVADFRIVGAEYFHVLRLQVRRGRALSEADREGAPLVAVINETMARTFLPNMDPIGQRLLMDAPPGYGQLYTGDAASFEIVGVIADERLTPFDDRQNHAVIYVSHEQDAHNPSGIIVRTALDAGHLESALRMAVAAIDKGVSVTHVKTVEELKSESMIPDRLRSAVLGTFAALALLLSAIGIYGVMSCSVVQRTHELGIRAALGATPGRLTELVIGQGLALATIGLAIGCAVAFLVTRFLRSFLFGISAADPPTWMAALAVITTVAALACYLPARYAANIDPQEALRTD
jgi:predicted permease